MGWKETECGTIRWCGYIGFRITIKLPYYMRVVEECHSMEQMKHLISN